MSIPSRLLLLMLAASCGCDRPAPATKIARTPTTVPVTLKPAALLPVQRTVEVVGTLFGEEESVVSAKVPGRIIALYKDVGDSVAPGEALVQLKPNDYQLAVKKAELAIGEVLAKLGLDALPPEDFDVTRVPTVVKARLQAENANAKFERGKKLFESKPPLLSQQDFSDLETALRVARAEYDVAMLEARGLVAEAQSRKGDLDIAVQRLNDATTRAPSAPEQPKDPMDNGQLPTGPHTYVVTHRYVNVGELVREITPCYRLVDDNPIKLRAPVPERFVGQISKDQKVSIRVDAYANREFEGEVSRINPQIEVSNRTFTVEVVIPNDEHLLKPGAFVRASIRTRVEPNVPFAPRESLVSFAGVNKLFTVANGKAVEIRVDPGEAILKHEGVEYIEIVKGINGDEKLVTSGAARLAGGVPVSLGPATTGPSTRPK